MAIIEKKKLESSIEDYLCKRCKENNILVIKQTGMRGIPDRELIKNSIHVFLELKRPGKKPRELQVAIAKKLRRYGAISLHADSMEGIDEIVDAMSDPDMLHAIDRLQTMQKQHIRKFESESD